MLILILHRTTLKKKIVLPTFPFYHIFYDNAIPILTTNLKNKVEICVAIIGVNGSKL